MSTNDGNQPVEAAPRDLTDTSEEGNDLDAFEKDFFQTKAPEKASQPEKAPEDGKDTPRALTDTSEDEADEASDDLEADEDTPEDDGEEEGDEPSDDSEDASDDGSDDVEEEEEETPQPRKKNRKSAKERIKELANERREEREARIVAEARLADLEARLAKLSGNQDEDRKPSPSGDTPAKGAPDPDAVGEDGKPLYPLGEFDPRYVTDLMNHLYSQKEAEAAQKAEMQKEKEAEARLVNAWNEKLTETEKEITDLRPKLAELETTFSDLNPDYGIYLAQTVMQMDRGPEVLYYLASNPDEARTIVASGPVAATISLGRLEGLLAKEAKKSDSTPRRTKAKAPPATPRGNGARNVVRGDTDDLDAFEAQFFK